MIWFPFLSFLDSLQRFIECVTAVFTQHSFEVNVGKLEVCAVVAGPGTQARATQLKRVQLRIHPRDVQGRPHELVLKESAKYLGSILHVGANNKDEANTVHGRLTPRVWRSSSIPLPLKIRLWQTLVLTKGLYVVEIRVLGRADLLYLERWQIKKLRHLARSPVHITRETSVTLRRRVQIPTIESQLRVRRLKWWRQLLAPRFAATTRDRLEQGHTWDASLAIRAALLGTFSFEANPLRPRSANTNYSTMRKNLFRCTNERNGPTAILKYPMRFPMNS